MWNVPKTNDNLYLLTARTGAIPYMAPQVADCQPYDTQCDVFGFAVLLWELLQLKPAFDGYSRREFLLRVVRNRERLQVRRSWPNGTRQALQQAWKHEARDRPNMTQVLRLLRSDLNQNHPKEVVSGTMRSEESVKIG